MYYLHTFTSSIAATGIVWGQHGTSWNWTTPKNTSISQEIVEPQVVNIIVGAAGSLVFNPASVSVLPGTLLRFDFMALNHTLTQSSLAHPCSNSSQFDTGFHQFNPANVSGKFIVDYLVQSNKPQWFYCAQESPKSHCQSGMVFSVNPGGNLDEFVKNSNITTEHSQITPKPALQYCSHSIPETAASSRPTEGTSFRQAQTASIIPEITNNGVMIRYDLITILGALLFATYL